MVVSDDRVVARLHFTGRFIGRAGQGQKVDFIATDIYRIVGPDRWAKTEEEY